MKKWFNAQILDLPIQPRQEEREKEMLNASHDKLSIVSIQIPCPNSIKKDWITGSEYLASIILNNIDEDAEMNSAKKKASKVLKNLLFSGHVMSVKFNPITSSLKYCFVKGVIIPQIRVNDNP